MSSLSIFSFDEVDLRVAVINDEPWFNASDAAKALGYTNPAEAIRDNVSDKYSQQLDLNLPGRKPLFISEPGLYQLVMRSTLPNAERFQDWVFEEVLPSIRKTGGYQIQQTVVKETTDLIDWAFANVRAESNLIQAAKIEAAKKQLPQYAPALMSAKESLTLLTPDEGKRYTPTQLGEIFAQQRRLEKAIKPNLINKALEKAGLQVTEPRINSKGKTVNEWKLTPNGEEFGRIFLAGGNGDGATRPVIRWLEPVLNVLQIEGADQ